MDKVARLPTSDLAALFGETGAARGIANMIVEKDFWVCWILKRLVELRRAGGPSLVFKGGTSLSKAYGAIRRFSEDIDLTFDRADLGYSGDRDPERDGIGKNQAGRLIDDLVSDVERQIATKLLPALRAAIASHLGEPTNVEWSVETDAQDGQIVYFRYPAALPLMEYDGMTYITPRVKLEFGARGDAWPTEEKVIRPYAAEDYPGFFESPECTVTVLSARRTFWEKVTALHAEAHRPLGSSTPQYFSRHYYDIAMLLDTEFGKSAAKDFKLLERVAQNKTVYFRSGWASYNTARPGTLRLMPDAPRIKDLRADYRAMAPMMFDEKPLPFDGILARIQGLQDALNA
jgi:predicted nucleotidyltransferase component of viral defense system